MNTKAIIFDLYNTLLYKITVTDNHYSLIINNINNIIIISYSKIQFTLPSEGALVHCQRTHNHTSSFFNPLEFSSLDTTTVSNSSILATSFIGEPIAKFLGSLIQPQLSQLGYLSKTCPY